MRIPSWAYPLDVPPLPRSGRFACGPLPPAPYPAAADALMRSGFSTIACLLDTVEVPAQWREACATAGLSFLHHPIVDYSVPRDAQSFRTWLAQLLDELARGRGLYLHCRGGLGRTGTALGCLLALAGWGDDPVALVRRVYLRGAIEKGEQERFVLDFARGSRGGRDRP